MPLITPNNSTPSNSPAQEGAVPPSPPSDDAPPGAELTRPKRRTLDYSAFTLSDGDIKKLFEAANHLHEVVVLELMVYCGLRRDEVINLSVRDVDFERGVLHLRKTKGLRAREVPVHPQVLRDLRHATEGRSEGYALPSPTGKRFVPSTINKMIARIGERAGVTHPADARLGLNPHLLRHTFARRFLREGGNIVHLQRILGHSSITTTVHIYGQPSLETIMLDYGKSVKVV